MGIFSIFKRYFGRLVSGIHFGTVTDEHRDYHDKKLSTCIV